MTTIKVQLDDELDRDAFPVERYKALRKMTVSESGITYLATDLFLQRTVVVKVLKPIEMDDLIVFQKNARICCRVEHKNIAQLLDFGSTAHGAAYVVIEDHDGISLADYIAQKGCLSPDDAVKTFLPVADALLQLHKVEQLHRSLRNSNISVKYVGSADQSVHLLDLGVGTLKERIIPPILYEGKKVYGEPGFIAPEEVLHSSYDVRSEIYILGCIMFEALTGRPPFVGQSKEQTIHLSIRRSPPSLTQVSPGMSFPHRLEALLAKCLAKSPDTRYQSMEEVIAVLRELSKLQLAVEHTETRAEEPVKQLQGGEQSGINQGGQNNQPSNDSFDDRLTRAMVSRKTEIADGNKFLFKLDTEKLKLVNADKLDGTAALQDEPDAQVDLVNPAGTNSNTRTGTAPANSASSADADPQIAHKGPNWKSILAFASCDVSVEAESNKSRISGWIGAVKNLPGAALRETRRLNRVQQIILAVILFVCLPSTAYLIHRQVTYVAAPVMVAPAGMVCYYSPWTEKRNGEVEVAVIVPSMASLANVVMIKMEIDREEMNLPTSIDGLANNLHIGQIWQFKYKEHDKKAFVEGGTMDNSSLGDTTSSTVQDAVYTVCTMFDELTNSGAEVDAAKIADCFTEDWSVNGYKKLQDTFEHNSFKESEDKKTASFHTIDESDIKLDRPLIGQIDLLVRTTRWIDKGPEYLRFRMKRVAGKWKIESLEHIGLDEWNRAEHRMKDDQLEE